MVKYEIVELNPAHPIRVVKVANSDREAFMIVATQTVVYKDLKDRTGKTHEDEEPEHMRATIHPRVSDGDDSQKQQQTDSDMVDWKSIEFARKTAEEEDAEDSEERVLKVERADEAAVFEVHKHGSIIGAVIFRPIDQVLDSENRRRMAQSIIRATVKATPELQKEKGACATSKLVVLIPRKVCEAERREADREMMSSAAEAAPLLPPSESGSKSSGVSAWLILGIILAAICLAAGIRFYVRTRAVLRVAEVPQGRLNR